MNFPQQPPMNFPQHKQPRKRNGALIAVLGCGGLITLVVVVVVIIAAVVAVSHNSPKTGTAQTGGTSAGTSAGTTKAAGLGSPVRDGKFQFVITKVTHAKSVGGSFGQTASGKYTVLHLTITNISNVSQTLDDSAQYVYDAAGRQFSADTGADIYANGSGNGSSVFLNQLNPGESVHGVIVFDLPKGDRAVRAELHDSSFSGGVTVSLAR